MKKLLLYAWFLFIGMISYAQENNSLSKEFDELRVQFRDTTVTVENAKTLARAYLVKAKKSKKEAYIGRGYYLLAIKNPEFKEKIKYLDSAIHYTKDLKGDARFPMHAYLIKGVTLDGKRDHDKALENYLLAEAAAKKNGNIEYQYYIKYNIGFLKRILGNYEEAEALFKECLRHEETKAKIDVEGYSNILLLLSSIYSESGNIAKGSKINKEGIQFTLANNRRDIYYFFVVQEGINLSIKGNHRAAIDSIEKGYKYIEKSNQIVAEFYLAESYYATNRKEEALNYFKKIDTVLTKTNDLLPRLRGSYTYLIDDAKQQKDKELQLYYTNQLLKMDSIVHADYRSLSKTIEKEYDIPSLLADKERLISELQKDNQLITKEKKWILIISILLGIIVISLLIYYYRLKKLYEKRYNAIISKSNTVIEEEIIAKDVKPQAVSLGVDLHIVEEVLQELEVFEQSDTYLKNQISLKDVAKIVNTNSKYLSKIINSYKGKNFTTYINDLRIDYLVSHVQQDTKYQKYTIRAIAEEIGFSNPEGFSRAFQKKTGLKPSYFIKKVREGTKKKL